MIVKIQQSQFTSDGNPTQLIYNRDRSYQKEEPLTGEIRHLLQDKSKAYYEAILKGDALIIGRKVPAQNW